MQESVKPMPPREMHKYVLGFVGVFLLIGASYPIALWRVSQHEKFAGLHVKSFTDAGKPKLPSDTAVAVPIFANNPSVAFEPANYADTMASISNANALAQLGIMTDANQSNTIINLTIDNDPTEPIVNPTDPVQLRALNQKVYEQIAKDWQSGRRLAQRLSYRVSVTGSGAIASFQPINQAASDFIQHTPLPNLLPSSVSTNTPVADFRVEFTSLGILEVSPWHGFGK